MGYTILGVIGALMLLAGGLVIVGLAFNILAHVFGVLFSGALAVLVTCVYFGSILWTFRDAEARGKPGWAAALLVAFAFWPLGLLAWYVFRPETRLANAGDPPPLLEAGHS